MPEPSTGSVRAMNDLANNLSRLFHPEDDRDDVMRCHHEAMSCCDLESLLGIGIVYFQHVNKYHNTWYSDVEAKRIPYRPEDSERFANEYARWMQGAECHLARAKEFEAEGYSVKNVEKVREYYERVRLANLDVRTLWKH